LRSIDRELSFLDQVCYDWASWDDTYDFVETLSEEYIQTNLLQDTFTGNKLTFIYSTFGVKPSASPHCSLTIRHIEERYQ